jgi:hypothetical protein
MDRECIGPPCVVCLGRPIEMTFTNFLIRVNVFEHGLCVWVGPLEML